jgi:hypothetical protein
MILVTIPGSLLTYCGTALLVVVDCVDLPSHITSWLPRLPMEQIRVLACVAVIAVSLLPLPASAWNIPGPMLSGAIAYQVLQEESPQTIDNVRAMLEKHPWYADQWQSRLQDVPAPDHTLVLFMQSSRWADDIRSNNKQQQRALWRYINWLFKPDGQPPALDICRPIGV